MPRFYTEEYLAEKLGTDRRSFHRKIKPLILRDFYDDLKKLNIQNPDIGLDADNKIYLRDPRPPYPIFETGTDINSYL